ncbi:PhnB protein [Luteibacter sp. Sphag1AF]|uniref:VOC family protein n=1 Tax=Luteibacter sp. Sphag1AF TaxID=2587031 RepID=UPI00162230E2|nr:VOC family protein [Luteibacter sp. Sphag1AF]MBB3226518.1 PhnB protein [Luteibacter sp. Sphag1AF]
MKLNPYLMFNGNCEEAFNFYQKALSGEITMLSRYGDMPQEEGGGGEGPGPIPPEFLDRIMHMRIVVKGQTLMGSDVHPRFGYKGIQGCSVALGFNDVAEAERVYKALSEGGKIEMPFAPTFWSEGFGMFEDKFGVPWMVNGPER